MNYTPNASAALAANRKLHWSRKPRDDRTIERFAEALSIHGTVKDAAKATGITKDYARALLARLKRLLGPQAI